MGCFDPTSELVLLCLLFLLLLLETGKAFSDQKEPFQTYIIHLDHSQKPDSFSTHHEWHRSILTSLSNPPPHDDDNDAVLYSYEHVLHGFSARLTKSQLAEIQNSPAHIATHKDSFVKLATTHSPQFLGLNHKNGLWPTASYGAGAIIGVVDTGVWPESESFKDDDMPPVPERWKGKCESGESFSPSLCNRKLIGARTFSKGLVSDGSKVLPEVDYDSARDLDGHGTHVSSTAAGNYVNGVSYFGYALGKARGVAPRAHIASYKVIHATSSSDQGGTTVDILAAIDAAITDGVDILSMSIGGEPDDYFNDPMAIGSLKAIEKGIFVVAAAGNNNDLLTSPFNRAQNGAPWITTVGAATIDRSFEAVLKLKNGNTVKGISYFPQSIFISNTSLYFGRSSEAESTCFPGSLNPSEAHRKIVVCNVSLTISMKDQEKELVRVGAEAGIFVLEEIGFTVPSKFYTIPTMMVPASSLEDLVGEQKVKSLKFVTTEYHTKPAPEVAEFSLRGPNPVSPNILKPDIVAPGVDILAATVPTVPVTNLGRYGLSTDYTIMSGTSMATPHVAGVAAMLKNVHPGWSPAAIRSAIMTTSYVIDNTGKFLLDQATKIFATPLAYGAGHIDPNKAIDPGLVYDLSFDDYVGFLCGLGYSKKEMEKAIGKRHWNCQRGKEQDLNYPSFMVNFSGEQHSSAVKKFRRVVTNVGNDSSVYHATTEYRVPGFSIVVEPTTLSFTHKYQKLCFSMEIKLDEEVLSEHGKEFYGVLKWTDQHNHVVSSPVEILKP
ncbi:hypothetical protein K2173_023150 [Erythroxylum novogranatense]|uniref:Uncharacterized protein n=1 Tax=Erythroxylum novogranatense TaxID=1862640 RepID=A0AAV8UAK1_9ROSI|nr:hypothetical protein K2173_023150 [Erythroxylum novogranatense]